MAPTSTDGRFVWWRTDLADGDLTLAAAPDLAVAAVPAAGAAEAGAPGAVPDPTPGLVPVATRDATIPDQDLEGSLAPSQEIANHALATAGPVLDPINPSLAPAPVSPTPALLTGNPSPVRR